MNDGEQILKCRDDKEPVYFKKTAEDSKIKPLFEIRAGSDCSWLEHKKNIISTDLIRSRIEPWLTALFQSEHFALLMGSGLSQAIHFMATGNKMTGMTPGTFACFDNEIKLGMEKSAVASGRKNGNIEDQIRVANELLRGLEIIENEYSKEVEKLKTDLNLMLGDFAKSILQGEISLITADSTKLEVASNYLVSFLMSFAGRTGTRDRLQMFTTNYDRYIELGSEIAGLHLIDRFVGSLMPIFRSSRLDVDMHYNPPGIRGEPRYLEGVAKFSKLHGSLDWISIGNNIRRMGLPFGANSIDAYLEAPGLKGAKAMQLMIYPNSAKDRETAAYPYVELFRDFASAICRPNNSLICYGYSFGDEHINRVIEDMLTIPSTHLVVISYDDPLDRIMSMYNKIGRSAQITLMIGNHLGDLKSLVDNYLPKPAIDRTTFRMAELLQSRYSTFKSEITAESPLKPAT